MGQGLSPTLDLGGYCRKKRLNEALDTLVGVEVAIRAFGLAERDVNVESHSGRGDDLVGVTRLQSACSSRQLLYRGLCLQGGWILGLGPCAHRLYLAVPVWSEAEGTGPE